MTNLTPREIVSELDRFIIGQSDAKRAVAVAMRNRWRRNQLGDDLRDEVYPKNILMIGPTGVGKTEISRRLAKLARAPFIKVEATKFTEVGYVGRDVEQIIRDLMDVAMTDTRERLREDVRARAEQAAENRVIEAIAGEDANWGRVVMAVGKAGEPADRDRLAIGFGGITVARDGVVVPDYDEAPVAKHMKGQEIDIDVDLKIGKGSATVWTCDLTHEYISINADYRS